MSIHLLTRILLCRKYYSKHKKYELTEYSRIKWCSISTIWHYVGIAIIISAVIIASVWDTALPITYWRFLETFVLYMAINDETGCFPLGTSEIVKPQCKSSHYFDEIISYIHITQNIRYHLTLYAVLPLGSNM